MIDSISLALIYLNHQIFILVSKDLVQKGLRCLRTQIPKRQIFNTSVVCLSALITLCVPLETWFLNVLFETLHGDSFGYYFSIQKGNFGQEEFPEGVTAAKPFHHPPTMGELSLFTIQALSTVK